MFGRRKRPAVDNSDLPNSMAPAEVYLGLRSRVLNLDPETVGLAGPGQPSTWGCLVETGYSNGVATLVCLSDGTTSLYTSAGGGIIGGGGHESVRRQTERLLQAVDEHLADMPEGTDQDLPTEGRTIIRALTTKGHRTFEAAEADLGEGRSALSPVFFAAHDVITQLRLSQEAPR